MSKTHIIVSSFTIKKIVSLGITPYTRVSTNGTVDMPIITNVKNSYRRQKIRMQQEYLTV